MPTKKNVTIREIAKLADVSTATVSLVLNDKKGVSDETRERIQKLIREHNYVNKRTPEHAAQMQICLLKYVSHGLVAQINQEGLASMINQIMQTCGEQNITLVVHNIDAQNWDQVFEQILQTEIQGILFLGTELEESRQALLEKIPLPVVVLDNSMRLSHLTSVTMNNRKIAYHAVKHLYDLGHRDIGYLRSSVAGANFTERSEGFYAAMLELHLEPPKPVLVSPTLNGAVFSVQLWLSGVAPDAKLPTAFVADNDCIAIAAVKGFQERGIDVPGDISIIGIGDSQFSSIMAPPLTTMHIPYSEIGKRAVRCLVNRITDSSIPTETVLLNGVLQARKSTRNLDD